MISEVYNRLFGPREFCVSSIWEPALVVIQGEANECRHRFIMALHRQLRDAHSTTDPECMLAVAQLANSVDGRVDLVIEDPTEKTLVSKEMVQIAVNANEYNLGIVVIAATHPVPHVVASQARYRVQVEDDKCIVCDSWRAANERWYIPEVWRYK